MVPLPARHSQEGVREMVADDQVGVASTLAERVREAVTKGGGFNAVVERSGISANSLTGYLKGRDMKIGTAQKLASACDVSASWLMSGIIDKCIDYKKHKSDEFLTVPFYDIAFSAGDGLLSNSFIDKGKIELFRTFFPDGMFINKNHIICVSVHGNSMSPTICDEDYVLIDMHPSQKIKDGYVYALRVDDLLIIKRIFIQPDGSLLISSDNKNFPSREIPSSEINSVSSGSGEGMHIFGRVIWRMGRLETM